MSKWKQIRGLKSHQLYTLLTDREVELLNQLVGRLKWSKAEWLRRAILPALQEDLKGAGMDIRGIDGTH